MSNLNLSLRSQRTFPLYLSWAARQLNSEALDHPP